MKLSDFKCPTCGHIEKDLPLIGKDADVKTALYFCLKCADQGKQVFLERIYTPPFLRGDTTVKIQN